MRAGSLRISRLRFPVRRSQYDGESKNGKNYFIKKLWGISVFLFDVWRCVYSLRAMTTSQLYTLAQNAPYNDTGKARFRSASLSFLRKVAKRLGLAKCAFSVRFNAGGIAVEGDPILHADNFYVNLSPGALGRGYWRECKGQKDYTGGMNRAVRGELTAEEFADEILAVIEKSN